MRVVAFVCLLLAAAAAPVAAQNYPVKETILDNGLKVLLLEDHKSTAVTFQVWYRVGSRNEIDGKSGLSHFLDDEARNAAPAELRRERRPGRPAAGDHDGIMLRAHFRVAAAFCAKLKSKTRAGATSLSTPPRLFCVKSI